MNRIFILVGLAAMSVGCAVSLEDPVEQFPERDPAAHTGAETTTTKGGEIEQTGLDRETLDSTSLRMKVDYDLGAWQVYNIPIPGK